MENKKNKIMTLVFIVSIFILIVSTTYAFFAPQQGGTTSTNATVTSNTTDLLTFSINKDISFTVTQADFEENGQNKSGDATATATLTPNNKTGAATMNYYLYLNIENNPTVYSEANTNQNPELMLQVFDGNNQLVTLTGLGTQKTIKGVTGYDITGVEGLKTLLDNHAISATNNTATIENWRIVITLINLDVNQNDNTGKEINAEITISKEEVDLGFTGTIYRNNTRAAFNNHPIEDELTQGWCKEYNGVPQCERPFVTQAACEYFEVTCSENNVTVGVGTYETDINTIRANHHYYLKHEVEDGIIESTEVCLWYNNNEFCLGPNYWVETGNGDAHHESAENGIATMNKLQTEMEAALETQTNGCSSNSVNALCNFGGFYCSVDANGLIECLEEVGICEVYPNGSSKCEMG